MNASTPVAQGNLSIDHVHRHGDAPAAMLLGLNGRGRRRSGGFTLIEMLVSLAITLIMMGAVVTLFGVISESVANSRSAIETADRLRAARDQLQLDLMGATATMTPPLRPEMDEGYFEIIEGVSHEDQPRYYGQSNSIRSALAPTVFPPSSWTLFGDTDDVLMFTVRNRKAPFLGRAQIAGTPTAVESPLAEVIYFLVQNGPQLDASVTDAGGTPIPTQLCTLYRRVLLISPSVGNIPNPPLDFYSYNDLSARFDPATPAMIPNTLGDLTKRENRFAHYGRTTYKQHPFLVNLAMLPTVPFREVRTTSTTPPIPNRSTITTGWPTGHPEANAFLVPFDDTRLGDDVLLTNVLSFDVRVWDPEAPVKIHNGIATEPHDAFWLNADPTGAFGAYVDLGYYNSPISHFSVPNTDEWPVVLGTAAERIYDTWSMHYENDGIDQDNAKGVDGGTDGLDNDVSGDPGFGVVDDLGEYDTRPPYAQPLRGIRVTIRVYDPNSKAVREAVVIQNFDTQ